MPERRGRFTPFRIRVVEDHGRLAQLGERLPYKQEVDGSCPPSPIPDGRTPRRRARTDEQRPSRHLIGGACALGLAVERPPRSSAVPMRDTASSAPRPVEEGAAPRGNRERDRSPPGSETGADNVPFDHGLEGLCRALLRLEPLSAPEAPSLRRARGSEPPRAQPGMPPGLYRVAGSSFAETKPADLMDDRARPRKRVLT